MAKIDDFKQALIQTFRAYEQAKEAGGKTVSDDRVGDIVAMERMIAAEESDPQVIRDNLRDYFPTMNTGCWLVSTGRSSLKKSLEAVMKAPDFSDREFLREMLAANDGVFAAPALAQDEVAVEMARLRAENIRLHDLIEGLEARAEEVAIEMEELRVDNGQLREENQRLHAEAVRGEGQAEAISPTARLSASFFGASSH